MPAPTHQPADVGGSGVPTPRLPRLPEHEPFAHVCARETLAARDACVHQHQHVWTHLREQAVRPMHFRDRIAVDLQPDYRMAATLSQLHTAHLRIGTWPILVATTTKSERVGGRIGRVEDCAIDGHESIASKESDFSLLDGWAFS